MHGSVDEVCAALDKFTLQSLELMEEKVSVTLQIEEMLRDGHIELAKSRYIRGMENIGMLQVPTEAGQFESLFKVQKELNEESIPQFDVINRKYNDEGREIPDPIKWFGVLVPQNLRNAQKRFQAVAQLSGKCGNIRTEIISTTEKLDELKRIKKNMCK
ncbi:coiled-coil domain-containing protein 115 [Diprion similis]|uniref:coiled-coil domain-containing protein 115 n=1 Tax=Diprion similis TaxID=362088 RepID=UPI001EF847F6|nr:coiled-coil domain-containing protein 115 [Diprion similis]